MTRSNHAIHIAGYEAAVEQFMDAFQQPRFRLSDIIDAYKKGYCSNPLIDSQIALGLKLIQEEVVSELFGHVRMLREPLDMKEVASPDTYHKEIVVDIADDIIDSIYVICWLAKVMGIPVFKIFEIVHHANMSKLHKDPETGEYKAVKRPDGKVIKPEGWKPANVRAVIEKQIEEDRNEQQPYTHFLCKVRDSLKDCDIGLMVDQRKYGEVFSLFENVVENIIEATKALERLARTRSSLEKSSRDQTSASS